MRISFDDLGVPLENGRLDGWKHRPLGLGGNKHVKNPFGHADPGRRPLEKTRKKTG